MKCDFEYCIYNENNICKLNEIQINSYGICEECVLISIPKTNLNIYKKRTIMDINKEYKNK